MVFHLSGEFLDGFFHILNPETMEDRFFPYRDGVIVFPSGIDWTTDWLDGADSKILVWRKRPTGEIEIVDLRTTQKTEVWSANEMSCENPWLFRILAWIEP